MGELHAPTAILGVITSQAALVATLVLYASCYRTYDGFRHWAGGASLIGLGFLAMIVRPWTPLPSIVLTNAFLAAGLLANLDGTLRFVRGRSLPPLWYLVPVVVAVLQGFLAAESFLILRQWIFTLVAGATLVGTGLVLLRGAPAGAQVLYGAFGGFQFLYFLAYVLRTALRSTEEKPLGLLQAGPVDVLFFLFLGASALGFLAGYLLLNAQRLDGELAASRAEVRMLSGLLPICAWCKKIRDGDGGWQPVERYVREHSEAEFSHGICPECSRTLNPEEDS